jgi:hypothetical protein
VNKDGTHSLSIIEVAVQRRCCVIRLGINHIVKLWRLIFSEPPYSAAKILYKGARFQILGRGKKQYFTVFSPRAQALHSRFILL